MSKENLYPFHYHLIEKLTVEISDKINLICHDIISSDMFKNEIPDLNTRRTVRMSAITSGIYDALRTLIVCAEKDGSKTPLNLILKDLQNIKNGNYEIDNGIGDSQD